MKSVLLPPHGLRVRLYTRYGSASFPGRQGSLSYLTVFILIIFCLAAFLFLIRKPSHTPSVTSQPKLIIIIAVDGLRSDRLGCYGYTGNTSPNLDAIAEEGIVFENHFSQSPLAASAHVSLLTSQYPLSHRVLSESSRKSSLAESIITLPQLLEEAGFLSCFLSGGDPLPGKQGIDFGFKLVNTGREKKARFAAAHRLILHNYKHPLFLYLHCPELDVPYSFEGIQQDAVIRTELDYLNNERVAAEAIMIDSTLIDTYESLSSRDRSLLLVHTLFTLKYPTTLCKRHLQRLVPDDWTTMADYPRQLKLLSDAYDAQIRDLDASIGRLREFLQAIGTWDNTLLIITSSRGQEFMEHNMLSHTPNLYDTLVHVPCIIKLPLSLSGRGVRITDFSEHVDLMPTIIDIVQADIPGDMAGASLIGLISGSKVPAKDVVFAFGHRSSMVRTKQYKYIEVKIRGSLREELYELGLDPQEQSNLSGTASTIARELKQLLALHKQRYRRLQNRGN